MPDPKTGKTSKIPVMMVIAVLAIVGLFAYSIWADREETEPTDDIDMNVTVEQNQGVSSTPPQQLSETEREQGRQRDQQRLAHIKQIRDALERSKNDKGGYPESLSMLVPDYLAAIPVNPSPNGMEYSYTPIGSAPYTYYDLNYSLEVGAEDVSYGNHTASPEGIAFP